MSVAPLFPVAEEEAGEGYGEVNGNDGIGKCVLRERKPGNSKKEAGKLR